MKFKKPKSVLPTIALVGGALVGAMASRVGYGLLPAATSSTTEAMYKGGIAVAAGAGAVFVDGNDTMANLVKGALIGASVEQGLSLVKGLAQDANVSNSMIKQAVGLACPCQENQGTFLGNPGRVIPLMQGYQGVADFPSLNPGDELPRENSLVFGTAI